MSRCVEYCHVTHRACYALAVSSTHAIEGNYGVAVTADSNEKPAPDPDVYFSSAHVLRAAPQPSAYCPALSSVDSVV
eukprot:7093-Heterococcus_DN1.PRE.3